MSASETAASAKQSVQLLAPPGYGAVAPFDKQGHAGLAVRDDYDYRWCSQLNAVYLNAVEFSRAALDFPIAFTREERSGEFIPVAVLGLRNQENLFVGDDGQWRTHCYIPAYFRRHPFCIAELPKADGAEPQRLVCVETEQLAPSDQPLIAEDGSPTERWQAIQQLLEAIEGARQQTRVFTRRLEALELLTGFDALATANSGQQMRLQGMFRVDEQKLSDIPHKELKQMLSKGELRCLYAHLISLENFGRLLDLTPVADGN